jgi:outer membrane protein TolC
MIDSQALRKPVASFLIWLLLAAFLGAGFPSRPLAQELPVAAPQAVRPEGLSLQLAVALALRTHPLIQAAGSHRDLADAELAEARAARLPLVQFGENLVRSNNPVFVFGSLLEQGRFMARNFDLQSLNNPEALNNLRTSLTFKLPLFDQRQSATRIARSRIRRQQADAQTDQAEQQIRLNVLRSYFGVLLAQAKQQVAAEAVKMAEADVKRIGDLVETGLVVASDLLSAEVQLAEFRQQQIQTEGDLRIAYATLNTALGLPIHTPQKVTGELLEKNFTITELPELLRKALENRPDYLRAGLAIRGSEEQSRSVASERLPRLDLFANFGASNRNFGKASSDYTVGANLTFNLFDAGQKNRFRQAKAAEALANAEKEQLAGQIRLDVVRAYHQFISARERLAVAGRVIAAAKEALRIIQARHHEGLTTVTEVLQAETALLRANTNLLAARYEHYVGYAEVLFATGRLTGVEEFAT